MIARIGSALVGFLFCALLLCPVEAQAQNPSYARVVSVCGTPGITYTVGHNGPLTVDPTGTLCGSGGGGGGGGAVFGPTAAGSPAANPPVLIGGTVDGTATGAVDNLKVVSGVAFVNCANCSGSGVSQTDQAAYTVGVSLFAPSGCFFQTTATTGPLATGTQGLVQCTAQRAFFTNLRNASGTEIGTTTTPLVAAGAGTAGTATGGVLTVQGVAAMTPFLVNPGTAANWGVGATGSAVPANAVYIGIVSGGNLTGWTGAVTQASGPWTMNLTQLNSVTVLTGTGAVGTGAQRIAVGTDTATIAGSAPGTAGTASVNVLSVQGVASMTPLAGNITQVLGSAISATNGLFTNVLQGNAVLSVSNPSFTTIAQGGNAAPVVVANTVAATDKALEVAVANANNNGQATAGNSSPVVLPAAQVTADVCSLNAKTNLPISQNGTSSVQLIALSGSTKIYVCSLSLIAAGATTVALTTGTGTACVTGNAAVIGTTTASIANSISLAANGGLTLGNGAGTVAIGAASSELCMILGTSVFVSGNLTYVQL